MANKRYMHRFSTTVDRLNYEDNPTLYTEPYLSVVEENRLTVYYNKSGAETGYLKFTQLGEEGGTIGIVGSNSINLEYSFDGKIWILFPLSGLFLNSGESVLLKGNNTSIYPARFTMTGLVRASGNIMSILYGESFKDSTTIPSEGCFYGLFSNCTSLTFAPELPATTLTENCYGAMFQGTSITNFPTLPASHVPNESYARMFFECTNLRGTGYISALTSEENSFFRMFSRTGLQGELTIVRPPNATWPVEEFIGEGINVTSVPDENDKIRVRRLYKTETKYSSEDGSAGNLYYDDKEWYEYIGRHVIDGHSYYLWEKNDNRSDSESERNSVMRRYAITESRYPTCDLEYPYTPLGFLTSDFDASYSGPDDGDTFFVHYDSQNDRLYKESLDYLGPDLGDWFEYSSPITIDGYTYHAWKKKTSSKVEEEHLINIARPSHCYLLLDTLNPVCSGSNPITALGYLRSDQSTYFMEAGSDYIIKYDDRTLGWKRWCRAENSETGAYAEFFTIDGYSIEYETLRSVFLDQLDGFAGIKLIIGYEGLLDVNLELLRFTSLVKDLVLVGSLKSCKIYGINSLQTLNLENSSITDLNILSGITNLRSIVFSPNLEFIRSFKETAVSELIIPPTVKHIGSQAFIGSAHLNSVVLSSGLLSIGYGAFYSCTSLEEIVIPRSVIYLGRDLFYNSGLTNAVVNASTKSLSKVFSGCANLSQVTLPENLENIDNYCFSNCTQLTSINLPSGLNNLGDHAFSASGITSIQIPPQVNVIDSGAFYGCSELTDVDIQTTNNTVEVHRYAFYNCTKLTHINLEKLTIIDEYAFYNCSSLTSVNLEKISTIKGNAFSNCTSLTDISISSPVTRVISGSNIFSNCNNLKTVYINCTNFSTSIFSTTSLNNVEEVIIGAKCSSIPGKFTNFTNLNSVTIQSNSITSLSLGMFQGCTSLTSFEIPSTITSIGSNAFKGSGLEEITIPDTVKSINNYAFDECANLRRITVGSGLTTIGSGAFRNCSSLVYLYFNNANRSFGELGLTGSTNVKEIVLGDLVGTNFIGTSPDVGLEDYAPDIETFTFGAGFSKIRANFFSQCDKLKSVTLGRNMTSIEENAFGGCTSLISVDIPESVTSIGISAFHGCTTLPSIVIPASVTSIGAYAFSNCIRLKDITSKNPTPPTVADNTFGTGQPDNGFTGRNTYNQNVNKLHVPRGATSYSTAWRSLFVYTQSGFTIAYDG